MNNLPNTNAERMTAWRKAHPGETPLSVIARLTDERTAIYVKRDTERTDRDRARIGEITDALVGLWEMKHLWDTEHYQPPHHAWTQP